MQPFHIYIRKRPLLQYEIAQRRFNVVDINSYALDSAGLCDTGGRDVRELARDRQLMSGPFSNLVQVHDGKLARNGRILKMTHK